ncbi:hypothetical protein IWY39_000553 [Sphingobium sp. JAI105]|uniref:hypothetical protein n=1 Tax=Sphingobium sp. JAI105 TaxID=2787715 RepID=UPI0018CA337F|nr:hypothetical protein [Sphingobium sp. JAI105]MBG6116749.1 hypothetical protein [Sphingobium sp. JAI105]
MTEENWKVGDLAVCISDNWVGDDHVTPCPYDPPRKEQVLRVSIVVECDCGLMLGFEGFPPKAIWHHRAFRKIHPDVSPANDDAWVEQLRHLRKKQAA